MRRCGSRPNSFHAAHGGMPQRNTRMDPAMRPEEPDRRLLRVQRRAATKAATPRYELAAFHHEFHPPPQRISGWSGLKASIFAGARAAGTMWSNHEPGVCAWHKSEALERINDVRFCGQSGRNMPAVGSSAPDP